MDFAFSSRLRVSISYFQSIAFLIQKIASNKAFGDRELYHFFAYVITPISEKKEKPKTLLKENKKIY